MVIDPARSRVVEDWHFLESGRGGERRILELRGELAPGTRLSEDSNPFALYDLPAPYPVRGASPRWIHADHRVTRRSRCSTTARSSKRRPSTASPGRSCRSRSRPPPRRARCNQQVAIDAWADAVIAGGPDSPRGPGDRHPAPASAAHARSRGRPAARRPATTSTRSCEPSPTSTAAISPCRDRREPARRTSGRT